MDVSPCNPLLNLRFVALVLSRTLNGSPDVKERRIERPAALPAFLLFFGVCYSAFPMSKFLP